MTLGRSALPALAALVALAGCAGVGYPIPHYREVYTKAALESPEPEPAAVTHLDPARVARGRYLVDITGCAGCHTDGALVGRPDPQRGLAGSEIGIAYTDPLRDALPGVAYPSNLTPDPRTGLGTWSDARIAAAIRSGRPGGGDSGPAESGHLAVMAWPLYRHLSDADVEAIVAYLRSIPAIEHRVPQGVTPGTRAPAPYVYFSVSRAGPAINAPERLR